MFTFEHIATGVPEDARSFTAKVRQLLQLDA